MEYGDDLGNARVAKVRFCFLQVEMLLARILYVMGLYEYGYTHAHIPFAHPALNALDAAGIDVEPYLKNSTLLSELINDYDRSRSRNAANGSRM